jgi:crotonobetainyl-CoA:carnitine CoA-transferase CaiB-like acyl-CoA transferase
MGADVLKIEKPGRGDGLRFGGDRGPEVGSWIFWGINRNKRSVGIDIKNPQAQKLLEEIVSTSDVVLENFRPGVMDKLGFGYEQLAKINTRIIYASLSAFGQSGPMRDFPGMDLILQATSGIMGLTGSPGGPPVRPAPSLADMTAGVYMAWGITMALFNRERTGRGQRVDLSMLSATVSLMADTTTEFLNTRKEYEKFESGHALLVPYQAFRASDEYFVIACLTNGFYKQLAKALGRPDLIDDPRFATNGARVKNRDDIVNILQGIFDTNTTAHWLTLCADADVPACKVNSLADLFDSEQVQSQKMVVDWQDEQHQPFKTTNVIVQMSETPGSLRLPPPSLGGQTDTVLRELGKSSDEIDELHKSGVFD